MSNETLDPKVFADEAIQDAMATVIAGNFTVKDIAKACHEANRSYCKSIGDYSQPAWDSAPDWQKASAADGVRFRLANPLSTPENSHENWLRDKERDGWKYGPVKDVDKKEHPCFVAYSELPEAQRAKDHIFVAVVDGLKVQLRKDVYEATPDERQSAAPVLNDEHKLFRKRYRQLSPDEVALHDQIKDKADELYALFLEVSPIETQPDANRERGANITLAKRHLEDAVYRAVKGLTA
jgi:hypothetical protein